MTDINPGETVETTRPDEPERATSTSGAAARRSLEICFLAFVGILVLMAFAQAISYELVSSRTPFVIMVPLLILIGVPGAAAAARRRRVGGRRDGIRATLRGENPVFSKLCSC